jgi:hypothetical protein
MKKLFACFVLLFTVLLVQAQNLPSGYIGTVNQTATNIYQNYSFSFTAPTTTVDYFGLAFRQDPGYWSIGSLSLTAQGSSTNLLNNGNLQYGGSTSQGLQAPADWGVWYQNGTYPAAAGTWYSPGSGWMGSTTSGLGVNTSTSGSWIDGAVGSFDGIYQGFSATAGTTYNFSFYSAGTNSYSNPSIMIGVYAGACSGGVFNCTPANSGFTSLATPQQTQGTGGAPPPPPPSGPTVVSTSTTNQVTTSTSYGNPTTTTTYQTRTVYTTNSAGNQIVQTFTDTVTTTTTPVYTTTTTTPVTTTTWSDGSTTTDNGTPTTSTTTAYQTSSSTTYATTPTSTAPWICCGGSAAPFNASSTNVLQVSRFNSRTTNDSQVYITQVGDNNNIVVDQEGTKNNYAYISNNGSGNNINVHQTGNSSTATNYSYTNVSGSYNSVNVTQTSTGGGKGAFINVANNNNSVTLTQTDAGSHYAEVGLSGGNKTVNITQSGSASQMASVQLTGNATSLTLQQTGTAQNFYAIQFNCATAGGCAPITVRQGN